MHGTRRCLCGAETKASGPSALRRPRRETRARSALPSRRLPICDVCLGDADPGERPGLAVKCALKCGARAHSECAQPGWSCDSCASGVPREAQRGLTAIRAGHCQLRSRQLLWLSAHSAALASFGYFAPPAEQRPPPPPLVSALFPEAPSYVHATLRSYQVAGIRWLLSQHEAGVGGILADEMGLGKTIQTLAFLAHLKAGGRPGPHLIVTPLSVLQNWANEARRFTPSLRVVKVAGSCAERDRTLQNPDIGRGDFDVMLTTYETVVAEERLLVNTLRFSTITVDEGQRIKDSKGILAKALARVRTPFRLLLTGTPIQNNLGELAALLGFVLPDALSGKEASSAVVSAWHVREGATDGGAALLSLRALLAPLMLRRMKADVETTLLPKIEVIVYVPLQHMQAAWLNRMLNVAAADGLRELLDRNKLRALWSQLRKILHGGPKQVLHTYERQKALAARSARNAEGAEFVSRLAAPSLGPGGAALEAELRGLVGEALISSSSKLTLLSTLLARLHAAGSRVLLFSQYTETLDVVEEALSAQFGADKLLRLDGSTSLLDREMSVRLFNAPGSAFFAYLISTRAGGVGLNLASADSVIMYDSCGNPQVDVQAIARAHRIGQKKQVRVYRLITEGTAEERTIDASNRKLFLSDVVVAGAGGAGGAAGEEGEGGLDDLSVDQMWSVVLGSAIGQLPSAHTGVDFTPDAAAALVTRAMAGEAVVRRPEAPPRAPPAPAPVADVAAALDEIYGLESPEAAPRPLRLHDAPSPIPLTFAQRKEAAERAVMLEGGRDSRTRAPPNRFTPPRSLLEKTTRTARPLDHFDQCAECNCSGLLVCCDFCPLVFCLSCLGMQKPPKGRFRCPCHSCFTCDRSAMQGGGKLFHCTSCVLVTCFDCTLYQVLETVGGPQSLARFAEFQRRAAAVHFYAFAPCADCAETVAAQTPPPPRAVVPPPPKVIVLQPPRPVMPQAKVAMLPPRAASPPPRAAAAAVPQRSPFVRESTPIPPGATAAAVPQPSPFVRESTPIPPGATAVVPQASPFVREGTPIPPGAAAAVAPQAAPFVREGTPVPPAVEGQFALAA